MSCFRLRRLFCLRGWPSLPALWLPVSTDGLATWNGSWKPRLTRQEKTFPQGTSSTHVCAFANSSCNCLGKTWEHPTLRAWSHSNISKNLPNKNGQLSLYRLEPVAKSACGNVLVLQEIHVWIPIDYDWIFANYDKCGHNKFEIKLIDLLKLLYSRIWIVSVVEFLYLILLVFGLSLLCCFDTIGVV